MWTDLRLAMRIVDQAARMAALAFDSDTVHVRYKQDGSEVTSTDLAVEDLVRRRLAEAVPDDGVAGEERPERHGVSGRRWLVDPISGTADFVRGRPTYSVDLAMEDEHGPALAVSALPSMGVTMAAGRGIGCRVITHDGETPGRVSVRDSLDGARVCLHGKRKPVLEHCVVVDNDVSVLRLVTGEVDAVFASGVDQFDLACLPVLVEEAGGRVTMIEEDVVLATNGVLHDAFLALLETHLGVEPSPPALQTVTRPS